MLKKSIFALTLIFATVNSHAQDAKKEADAHKTKMEAFFSKTGTITKFIDYNLTVIKTSYVKLAETRIRKISNGTTTAYFYQIEKPGEYNSSTTSIEYDDLIELIKAVSTLKAEIESDITSNPDYLENKFITVDGFQVGYLINKGKATWYLKLDKYSSDNTIFISNVNVIEVAFGEGKNKIEELKK